MVSLVAALAGGCVDEAPVERQVHLEEVASVGHVYDPAVVAGPSAWLVSWTEHARHAGEASERPDILFAFVDAAGVAASIRLTDYAGAQLQSRAFWSPAGFGVAWREDLAAGDRLLLWRPIDEGTAAGPDDAYPMVTREGVQSVSAVATLGTRAFVAFRDPEAERVGVSVVDLQGHAVVREVELPLEADADFMSLTAGEERVLVLSLRTAGATPHLELTATLLDREGAIAHGPTSLGGRFSPEPRRPVEAGFHDGAFVFPWIDFEVVTVDRPCCPQCQVIQPPTCTIEDHHVEARALTEAGAVIDLGCLDCRRDVGTHLPRVTADADGVYFLWDMHLARLRRDHVPSQGAWRSLMIGDTHLVEGFTDLAARDGQVILVGRGGPVGEPARLHVGLVDF